MKTSMVMGMLAILAAGASSALGGSIQKHHANEQRRINQGVHKGQLTGKEAHRLQNQQGVIDAERRQARDDGRITRPERRDIRHDQKRLSKDIRHKRHNNKHAHRHHR